MATDKDYDVLLQQYNILVAKHRDLLEQTKIKTQQMQEYESEHDVIEKHARELCEMILAKDRSEMVLGNNKTWHKTSTDEMISKAKLAFVKCNQQKTDILNQLMAVAERRGQELESLKDQIAQMMTQGNISGMANITADQLLKQAEEKKREEAAISKTPASAQTAIKEGHVTCVVEEDTDCDEDEVSAIREMIDVANTAKLSAAATGIRRSEAKKREMDLAKNQSVALHMVDLKKIAQDWGDIEWYIIEQIGKTGIAKGNKIVELAIDKFGPKKRTAIDRALRSMKDAQILIATPVSLPRSKKISLYEFAYGGTLLYKDRFGVDAVTSEVESVKREHSNVIHGYGIMDLQEALIATGKYTEVLSCPRKNPYAVEVGGRKLQYIPDLVCKTARYSDFFEYEIGSATQEYFNEKCDKMCQVTRFLNFICPNRNGAKDLMGKVDRWIASRNITSLKTISVRIGTILSIEQDKWLVQYKLAHGAEPVDNYFDRSKEYHG